MTKEELNIQFEHYIEQMFNTMVQIEEFEATEWPIDHISDRSKTMLSMCHYHMLMRNLWDKFEQNKLPIRQRLELVLEIWKITREHYKKLYNFDAKEIANNI